MATAPPFTLTNESLTVIIDGKPTTVQKSAPNFIALRGAIIEERWDDIPKHLTVAKSLKEWAYGRFSVIGESIRFEEKTIPDPLSKRVLAMASRGEDPRPLFRFWERLQKNPSFRSVEQLWNFLQHEGIPLTKDGCFLAYKSVNWNHTDHHTGAIDNHPGKVNEMPRNQISDDPRVECHVGFHVGALAYVSGTYNNGRIVICKVDPEHVVCVPYDHSMHKMRVCKYKVIGYHNGELMPSTSLIVDDGEDSPKEIDGEPTPGQATTAPEEVPPSSEEPVESSIDEEDEDAGEVSEEEAPTETTAPAVAAPAEPKQALTVPKKFEKFQSMDMVQLMEQQIHELRHYAGHGLKIVGASKIPGGKATLVAKILEVRDEIEK